MATFCGVISTMSPGVTDFRLTIEGLNNYMSINHLPPSMRQRLRDYFHRARHLWQTNASQQILSKLSPMLQGEILLQANEAWLVHVPWLANEEARFLAEVGQSVSRLVGRWSVTQSLSHSVTQILRYSVTRPLNHSITQSVAGQRGGSLPSTASYGPL